MRLPFLAALTIAALAALPAFGTVNVNTAQQSELQAVKGLDARQAKTIIQFRNQNGPYRTLDDLAKALGEPAAERVKAQVAFDGPPYVAPPKPEKKKSKKKGSG